MELALEFPHNCTAGDYKEWSEALSQDSVDKGRMRCVQGMREVFQWRAPRSTAQLLRGKPVLIAMVYRKILVS